MSHPAPFHPRGAIAPAALLSLATIFATNPCGAAARSATATRPGRAAEQPAATDWQQALLNRGETHRPLYRIRSAATVDGWRALLEEKPQPNPSPMMAHRARTAGRRAMRSPCG
jgi:hypothetical protein